ncbi:hypothetical protein QSV37_15295 [Acinetobacter sp. VNK23]|uniref:hypothetical protein n=1 Tax=Acinetobacter thutiue TaxID=2998078 RepID=UPI002577C469|nr:hypothetical protein [Acinetobacter thutiue]MDM1021658.1 hypothetical protein [Acinetobacter thutiue]
MLKIMKLEEKIIQLGIGEFLFVGRDFNINEMQSILHYLKNLETKRVLEIVYTHKESETGTYLIDLIKIQKIQR